jgi:hypothetical protein
MDYGKRPYSSPSSDYKTYMAEITDQYVRSIGGVIPAGMKRPYVHQDYNSMQYLFNTTKTNLAGATPTLVDLDWVGIQPVEPIETPLSTSYIFILNFDGADGQETWTEETSGLQPVAGFGGSPAFCLDTSNYYNGVSSLRGYYDNLHATGIIYIIPALYNAKTVNLSCYIYNMTAESFMGLGVADLINKIGAAIFFSWDNLSYEAYIMEEPITVSFTPVEQNKWNKFELIINEAIISLNINDTNVATINGFGWNNMKGYNSASPVWSFFNNGVDYTWIDEVKITMTM